VDKENWEADKVGLNEWLKGYELRFGSGLNPNGSDARLLGRIPANGLVEWVCTQRPDRSTADGALGLGWAGRGEGEAGKVGPVASFWPKA
jgi:hypothetical protein